MCSGKVKFLKADISRFEDLVDSIKKYLGLGSIEGIVHLAALVGVDEVRERPSRAIEVNVLGTLNMLELARKLDIERFVYASSVAVYGEPKYLPVDEEHPTRPINLYGLTKLMGEELLWRYYEDYGIKTIALRYFNVYGPRMRSGPYSGVIYRFITALLSGNRPIIYGDGNQTRDFVYVYDVADANLRALQTHFVGPVNIGTGYEVTINELFMIIKNILGVNVEPIRTYPRPGDIRKSRASIDRAVAVLGWKPKVRLIDGLRRTIEYYSAPL